MSVDTVNAFTGQVYSMKPSGSVTWKDLVGMLQGATARPGQKTVATPAEKIAELERKIDQLTKHLQELKEELEELRCQLANETPCRR